MTTNQLLKSVKSLSNQYASVLAEVAPYRDRFHAFISHHNVNQWIDYRIEGDYYTPKAEDFEMFGGAVETGIYFSCFAQDSDGGDILNFTIPFEYIEDPQTWEENFLSSRVVEQELVEQAYETIAPGVLAELGLEVYIDYAGDGTLSAVVVEKGNKGITLGHPDTEKMIANSFSVDVKTGKILHRTLVGSSLGTRRR